MKTHITIFTIIFMLLASACAAASEPEEVAEAETAVPTNTTTPGPTNTATTLPTATPTQVPTNTPTPSPTLTPSPVPTPIGGGSGKLLYINNFGIYRIDIGNPEPQIVVSSDEMKRKLGVSQSNNLPFLFDEAGISPDGTKFWMAICLKDAPYGCLNYKFFLGTVDLEHVETIWLTDPQNIRFAKWSPDSQSLMVSTIIDNTIGRQGTPLYVVDATEESFGEFTRVYNMTQAFWSTDGQQIYHSLFTDWYIMNKNGSNRQALNCTHCSHTHTSWDGAQSTSGQVVVSASDYTITIADADLSNSSSIQLSGFANHLLWSPDNTKVVRLRGGLYDSFITVVDIVSGEDNKINPGFDARYMLPCGWTPDNNRLIYLANIPARYARDGVSIESPATHNIILHDLATDQAIMVRSYTPRNVYSCPVFIP